MRLCDGGGGDVGMNKDRLGVGCRNAVTAFDTAPQLMGLFIHRGLDLSAWNTV